LRHYQALRERQPESLTAALGEARCRRRLGHLAEARRILEQLVAEHPRHDEVLSELGQLAWTEHRLADTERWLKKALELYPYHLHNLYTMYLCLKSQGKARRAEANRYMARYEKVQEDLERLAYLTRRAIAKKPHDPAIPYEIGLICMRNGNTDNG